MFLTDTSKAIHCRNRYPVIQKLFCSIILHFRLVPR